MISKEFISVKVNMMRDLKNINYYISGIKYGKDRRKKEQLIGHILKGDLPGKSYFIDGIMPKSIRHLGKTRFITFQHKKIISELQVMNYLIRCYKSYVSKYLKLREKYEFNLLRGNYEKALELLMKIESEVCISLWSISQHFLIKEFQYGTEEHKKLLSNLTEECESEIITFMLDYISFKAEKKNSYESLLYKIDKRFDNKTTGFQSEVLRESLIFLLDVKYSDFDEERLSKVLAFQNMMSIIDIYECYIKSIQLIINKKDIKEDLKEEIIYELLAIKDDIDDFRIEKCITYISKQTFNIEASNYSDISYIIDSYTESNYKVTRKLILDNKVLPSSQFSLLDIFVRTTIFDEIDISYKEDEKLISYIMSLMYNLYTRNDVENNIKNLLNLASTYNELRISAGIINFLNQFKKGSGNIMENLAEFNSMYYTPLSKNTYKNRANELICIFEAEGLFSSTKDLFKGSIEQNKVDDLRYKYYCADSSIKKDISKAIQLYEELQLDISNYQSKKNIYYWAKTCNVLYNLYIKNGMYKNALEIIIKTYFINPNLIISIDLNTLYQVIKDYELTEIRNSIYTPIFIYLLNDKDYEEQYISIANYSDSQGFFKFSDILGQNELLKLYNDEIQFILKNIYKLEVIKRFVFIDGKELIDERIFVIRYLIGEGYHIDELQDELNSLVKEQSIKEKIKVIDNSKIDVETKGILQDLRHIYLEKLQRFKEMKKYNLEVVYIDLAEGNMDTESIYKLIKSKSKNSQSYFLFKEIVESYINELLFNLNYGLDKFLSSRIRHGSLQDYLTKPFTNNNLLNTKQNKESKQYLINKHIEKNMNGIDVKDQERIMCILSEFSYDIMSKIEEVQSWVRIKSSEYPNGLFNYSVIYENMDELYNKLKDINEYDNFFEEINSIFWKVTEENLSIIREKIEDELNIYFRQSLDNLGIKLNEFNRGRNLRIVSELKEKIGLCNSNLVYDLDTVKSWFQLKRNNQYTNFSFYEAMTTCVEINNKLNKDYSYINVTRNINDQSILFKGNKFVYWIDIINILYVNAIKHSGFAEKGEINIDIEANILNNLDGISEYKNFVVYEPENKEYNKLNSKFIKFKIENNLSENKNIEEVSKKIQDIFKKLEHGDYVDLIRIEGGTGLSKVYHILKNNFKNYFKYSGVCENNKFAIEIILALNEDIVVEV